MAYNPADDDGYREIRVGDVVRASGETDGDLFEVREPEADWVAKLSRG